MLRWPDEYFFRYFITYRADLLWPNALNQIWLLIIASTKVLHEIFIEITHNNYIVQWYWDMLQNTRKTRSFYCVSFYHDNWHSLYFVHTKKLQQFAKNNCILMLEQWLRRTETKEYCRDWKMNTYVLSES